MNLIKNDILSLRAVEPDDIDALFEVENNLELWKYSNRSQPYSKDLLQNYISNAHKGVFETRQVKFTVANLNNQPVGFIDLFDFEPLHRRAGVGIILKKEYIGKGYGRTAIKLVGSHAKEYLNIHSLFANIEADNKKSIRAFESCGYRQVGLKKAWNFYQDQFHDEYLYQKIYSL